MTERDIEAYLVDNQDENGLSTSAILDMVPNIHQRLDYSGLYEQIDNFVEQFKHDHRIETWHLIDP